MYNRADTSEMEQQKCRGIQNTRYKKYRGIQKHTKIQIYGSQPAISLLAQIIRRLGSNLSKQGIANVKILFPSAHPA